MATVHPFRALRPAADNANRVSCPPYDVVNTPEARALKGDNADSFLRVTRPEIDLPEGTDEHASEVYSKAAENLAEFVRRGVLAPDAEPHFYVYAQTMGGHRQVGLVACASVAEYVADTIKKHEKTRADKEDDRTRHIDTLGSHDEPVFLTYRSVAVIDAEIRAICAASHVYDFVSPDGVRHEFWVVPTTRSDRIASLFRDVPALYVADGHHRSAAAMRVNTLRAGRPGEHDRFPAVIFPHDQMQILAYNRLVRDPRGRSSDELLSRLADIMIVGPGKQPAPDAPKSLGVFLGGRWHSATVRPGSYDPADPVASLDCSIVQDQILAPLFGITDPRRDTHVDFVGGIRGARELERRVRDEGWSLALHLHPTRIEELIAVSDAGLLMPPKSTWFEPKLRSGLFVHAFGE